MKNLQHINNRWYLERIRQCGLQLGDEIHLNPFNKRSQKIRLLRKDYNFSHSEDLRRPWDPELVKVMDKDFLLQLQLIPDGNCEEGRYFLSSRCSTPFKINGSFCYQSFVERGDEIEFGLHQITIKDHVPLGDNLEIPRSVISSELPILIEGETGTGKTYLAKRIYELSEQTGRFVHLNLSSFAPQLFESELFGHVRGSFTGATRDKTGAIVEAHGGTLFIDEVDSLPNELQVKLLLFLDDGRVRPVGDNQSRKVSTRLIIASGRNLQDLVVSGHVRKDFFFRIQSSYKITLPTLRENRQKILGICEQFAHNENICLSEQLLDFYQQCPWPGNIRQLMGHLKTKKVLSPSRKWEYDEFDQSLQRTFIAEAQNIAGEFLDLKSAKQNYIRKVFESSGRDHRLVSKILKVSPSTLKSYL